MVHKNRRVALSALVALLIWGPQFSRRVGSLASSPPEAVTYLSYEVSVPEGGRFRIIQSEGQPITMESGSRNCVLISHVSSPNGVELDIRIGGDPLGLQSNSSSARSIHINEPFGILLNGRILLVTLKGIGTSTPYSVQSPGPSRCCVTCGGLQTCACAVAADCGSCCAPKCCGLDG